VGQSHTPGHWACLTGRLYSRNIRNQQLWPEVCALYWAPSSSSCWWNSWCGDCVVVCCTAKRQRSGSSGGDRQPITPRFRSHPQKQSLETVHLQLFVIE